AEGEARNAGECDADLPNHPSSAFHHGRLLRGHQCSGPLLIVQPTGSDLARSATEKILGARAHPLESKLSRSPDIRDGDFALVNGQRRTIHDTLEGGRPGAPG